MCEINFNLLLCRYRFMYGYNLLIGFKYILQFSIVRVLDVYNFKLKNKKSVNTIVKNKITLFCRIKIGLIFRVNSLGFILLSSLTVKKSNLRCFHSRVTILFHALSSISKITLFFCIIFFNIPTQWSIQYSYFILIDGMCI